jgi:hypothetical protein
MVPSFHGDKSWTPNDLDALTQFQNCASGPKNYNRKLKGWRTKETTARSQLD